MHVEATTGLHISRRRLMLISIVAIVVLVPSLSFYIFMINSNGTLLNGMIHVKSERELQNSVNTAAKPAIITLDKDIALTKTLLIPDDKEITLKSNRPNGFYKLTGTKQGSTITVESGGMLRIDGIIITHDSAVIGSGVIVKDHGTLIMLSGEISGNTNSDGAGVYACLVSTFKMSGGVISDNTADNGGGVSNSGTFSMSGDAAIVNNTANMQGGGVYVSQYSETATFRMTDGIIANNTATSGGGVYKGTGYFALVGGMIVNNTATGGGGGVNSCHGTFIMLGGKIINNTAYDGGGVLQVENSFDMSGGTISGNTALDYGGGVYVYCAPEYMTGSVRLDGTISKNMAICYADVYKHYVKYDYEGQKKALLL